jgi:uncharacterized protein YjaG (DUF416 family)
LLDLVKTTNIVPGDGGHLDNSFTKSGRIGNTESESEVLHRYTESVEDFSVDGIFVQVDEVHFLANLLHSRFGAKRRNIGTDISMRIGGNLFVVSLAFTFKNQDK